MSAERFFWQGILARGLFSLFLVFSTYNPTGYSWLHWMLSGFDWFWAKVAAGLLLLTGYIMVWVTTYGVLRRRGILILVGLSFAGAMTASRLFGGAPLEFTTIVLWALGTVAFVFTIGLSYSHIHHRIGGITHIEEIAH